MTSFTDTNWNITDLLKNPAPLVDDAIQTRMSVRAFTDRPVEKETIVELLELSSRSGSGSNSQPWLVYVLQGKSRDSLVEKMCAAYEDPSAAEPHTNYPPTWGSPYLERRRANGWGLYGLLGIAKGDKEKMHAQQQGNYRFFDAPVGMIFTVDRIQGQGRGTLMDIGMCMENLMLAARARGLHTCALGALNNYASIVLSHCNAKPNEVVLCGLALGYADESALINTFYTDRVSVSEFTTWLD